MKAGIKKLVGPKISIRRNSFIVFPSLLIEYSILKVTFDLSSVDSK